MQETSRRKALKRGGTALVTAGFVAGCSGEGGGGGGGGTETSGGGGGDGGLSQITVGSWTYTEQVILGYLSYEILDANTDITVVDEVDYGNNAEVFEGFTRTNAYADRDDLPDPETRAFQTYWDYTGTMWAANPPTHSDPILASSQAQYDAVKEEMESEYDLTILEMTSFENSFGWAGDPEFIDETGIETVSALAEYVNSGNYDVTIAIQSDFYNRTDGWQAMLDHYEFEDSAVQTWENDHDGVVRTEIGVEASEVDQGNANIGLVYTTDATINEYDLRIIEDDQAFWPFYNLTPVVADEAATDPVITELNKLPSALGDATTMRRLNGRVSIDEEDPQAVARSFLSDEGLI